eukprot:TRINITY_DN13639_c0_g1_i1.p1 TRINITY_DN13639_c0_g1~~TRINITY_DN13639_c0_g1_i1.p1  ORF type:complete len:363 (+),score=81.96 TRINITY_DN13639_c0_g1_i1:150-1238(+)
MGQHAVVQYSAECGCHDNGLFGMCGPQDQPYEGGGELLLAPPRSATLPSSALVLPVPSPPDLCEEGRSDFACQSTEQACDEHHNTDAPAVGFDAMAGGFDATTQDSHEVVEPLPRLQLPSTPPCSRPVLEPQAQVIEAGRAEVPAEACVQQASASPCPSPTDEEAQVREAGRAEVPAEACVQQASAKPCPSPTDEDQVQSLLKDINGFEAAMYGDAFSSFATAGFAEPDNRQLRDFLLANSALSMDDLDTELLKVASASESFSIELAGFLKLMQDHSVADSEALNQFVGLTSDGETITSEDCRTGLLRLMESELGASIGAQRADVIFDTVMGAAGLTISMEEWFVCCKQTARIVRLLRFAHL